MIKTFKKNWPVYFMEAWGLGTFMISAVLFTIIVEHPDLPVRQSFDNNPLLRRLFIGPVAGMILAADIYKNFCHKSSGALKCHMSGNKHNCNTYKD